MNFFSGDEKQAVEGTLKLFSEVKGLAKKGQG
jgi:hypothetical protein